MKTFVVRLFVPAEVEAHAPAEQLRGLVEEVGSGRSASFGESEELLAFFARTTDGQEGDPGANRARVGPPQEKSTHTKRRSR